MGRLHEGGAVQDGEGPWVPRGETSHEDTI